MYVVGTFTLYKVQKYFSGFGLMRKEADIRWLSLEACDPQELGLIQEFFTYMETSPLPVKGCKI
jgi:hypothetical protein